MMKRLPDSNRFDHFASSFICNILLTSLLMLPIISCDDETSSSMKDVLAGASAGEVSSGGITSGNETSPAGIDHSGEEISPLAGEMMNAGMEVYAGTDTDAGIMTAGDSNIGGEIGAGTETNNSAGMEQAGEMITEELVCEAERSKSERLIALSFPFSDTIGEQGHTVQVYQLSNLFTLDTWGARLDLGFRSEALQFSRDGLWLIALGERGQVASIDLRGDLPEIVDMETLPAGAYHTLQHAPQNRRFDVVNRNSDELSGLYHLQVNCQGSINLEGSDYYLRLIQGFSRFSSSVNEAIVFGGQALFDPIDLIDLRWISFDGEQWSNTVTLDVYEDFIDAINVGLSPLGDWVTLVNGSPFTDEGGQVRFIEILTDPPQLVERQLFENFSDVRGSWFMPDGQTVAITQFEENTVQFFGKTTNSWMVGQRMNGIGLAEMMSILSPFDSDMGGWWLFIPSTSPSGGSGVSVLHVLDAQEVMTLPTLPLGEGYRNIPGVISGWPKAE